MPIISARGINAPVTYQRNFVSFYEGRGARKGWDNNQLTALVSGEGGLGGHVPFKPFFSSKLSESLLTSSL